MIMMTLLQSALKYHFVEKLYPATSAGLGYSSYASDKGLVFKVKSSFHLFSPPLVLRLTEICQKLQQQNYLKIIAKNIVISTSRRMATIKNFTYSSIYTSKASNPLGTIQPKSNSICSCNRFTKPMKISR